MQKPVEQKPKIPVYDRGNKCLNCGHPLELSDRYCSYCGQINSRQRLSLGNYFREFAGSIFNYDSRFRYTIKDLLFKPGTITRDYVDGKRLTYANPFRFYLSVSILFFIISGLLDFFENTENTTDSFDWSKLTTEAKKDFQEIPIDSITYYIEKGVQQNRDTTQALPFEYQNPEKLDSLGFYGRTKNKITLFRKFSSSTAITRPEEGLDSLKYPKTRTNIWLYKKSATFNKILDEPFEFYEYLVEKTPFFIFFFTPLFALAFVPLYLKKESYREALQKIKGTSYSWFQTVLNIPYLGSGIAAVLATLRRFFYPSAKHNYVEHVIFIFHIFSFMFLGMLLLALPDFVIGASVLTSIFLFLICPFYFYKALRNFYKEGRLRTLLKFLILNFVFLMLSGMSMILFLLITAATY
ncbi:DUF3667 domain-containing protein [Leeuwenhoekiella parthenopeia]|uniref:DUF3667 domain-containing protein n=1 Tax=Leeuwenhoekiella parthenopeia TaxID=2890320 RepID=A0ABS8GRZ0_9FLAO|nr:DUF3667 domain-containing protein [Leeuwenhoekiella parthenopeia]